MEIYFIMLLLVFIFSFIENKSLQKKLMFIIFFVVSSLRYIYLGADTKNYINYFKYFSTKSFKDLLSDKLQIERGFAILNKIIGLINNNERYFIVITSIIVLILATKFIYNNSRIPWFSFYLFLSLGYYISSLNILRQMIAILILVNSLDYIRNRDIKKFLLFYVIAVSIHTTAAIFILLYFVYPLKINLKYLGLSLVTCVFLYLFSNKILGFLFSLSAKYDSRYSDNLRAGNGKGMLLMLAGVLFGGYFLEKVKIKKDKNYIFYHMLNISVILQIVSLKFSLFVRVVRYFSIGMIIFIPNIVYKIKGQKMRLLVILITCIVTCYYLYMILNNDLSNVVPYKFLF